MTEAECKLACANAAPVAYRPHKDARPERGLVMRCSPEFAFVLYEGRTQVQATRFEDLEQG